MKGRVDLTKGVEVPKGGIADLEEIRRGAALGATALQSVPVATNSTVGTVYVRATTDGLAINSDGMVYVAKCTDQHIANKSNTARPLAPDQIDKITRAGLLSNSQITDADKPAICQTIGAIPYKPVTLIQTVRLT